MSKYVFTTDGVLLEDEVGGRGPFIIHRPSGTTQASWMFCAADIVRILNAESERREAHSDANMALYSGLWRYGLPEVPRGRMTLPGFINAVTAHFDHCSGKKAKPRRNPKIAWSRLVADVDEKMAGTKPEWNWADLSRATGVPESTLVKFRKASGLDAGNMIALCEWLGKPASHYLIAGEA